MTEALTIELVRLWLRTVTGEFHYTKVLDGLLTPESYPHLRTIMSRLVDSKEIKPVGHRDGIYTIIKKVEPVRWTDADEAEYFNLNYPQSLTDNTSFGFENFIKMSPGDLMLIGGVSNAGKSTLALNMLKENIHDHKCVLMGNEYTTLDGMPSPKFKRRLAHTSYISDDGIKYGLEPFLKDGKPNFALLPVAENYESYIVPHALNLIDWIFLPENPFMIGKICLDIKRNLGKGLAIVVLQKEKSRELAVGGQFTEYFADFYITIDFHGELESRLTIGKVKESIGKVRGRTWAFSIIDNGSNLKNIREIIKCGWCYGKGYIKRGTSNTPCEHCHKLGFVEKEDVEVV